MFLTKIILNSFLGLLLIFLWSRFVDLESVITTLKGVNLNYLVLFFLLFLLSGFFKALRFYLLLRNFNIPLKDLVFLNYLSQLFSFMVPLRLGEISKSVYLSTRFNLQFGKSLVWVFIDRFLDFWVACLLIVILGTTVLKLPGSLRETIYLILIAFSLISLIMVKNSNFSKKVIQFLSNYLVLSSIKRYFLIVSNTIIEGFSLLSLSPFKLALVCAVTVLTFILDGVIWLVIFSSLGFDLGPFKALLGNGLMALTFIIPSAPGYVGSAEAAGLAIFGGLLGIESNLASAGIVLFHLLTILAIAISGVSSLYFLNFDLNLVWKKLKKS